MYTNQTNKPIRNNYTSEAQVYCASYPYSEQKNEYLIKGAIATVIMTTLIMNLWII